MAAPDIFVVAVDVGTKSARAGVFDHFGGMLGLARHPIALWCDAPGEGEHASEDIWQAVCAAVRGALGAADIAPAAVTAIAFDATCSLVLRGRDGAPLPLGPQGRDTIAWFDHRAAGQAGKISATGNTTLTRMGGAMSPEMQLPKLMWIKEQRPDIWANLHRAMDLADFLAWRACGKDAPRSMCTMVAKWGYDPTGGFDLGFLDQIEMGDLPARSGATQVPTMPGTGLGCLSPDAAADLGLAAGCRVAQGMVDGYAGALGALAGRAEGVALVAGTSTCVMRLSNDPWAGPGIWGPFPNAILPDHWVSEGGQSATGAALDMVLRRFGKGDDSPAAHDRVTHDIRAALLHEGPSYARHINVLPDFNGNRTPLADPLARATIAGLSLDADHQALPQIYWRVAVGLAMNLRQIIEGLGARPQTLGLAGGHGRNDVLIQLYADATGCQVMQARGLDSVLLGTAMAALTVARNTSLASITQKMDVPRHIVSPNPKWTRAFDSDYAIFQLLQRQRAELHAVMGADPC